MAISYPLTLPFSTRNAARIVFRQRSTVGVSRSPFTGEQQVYAHQGEWWEADIQLPPVDRADAEEWIGALASLNGQEGTFLLGDRANASARGIATGTPLVKGASQTGKTLLTDGWTISQTGILKRGDWIQLGSGSGAKLHKVVQDANSDGSGNATLEIWPRLRSSPADNAAITVASCVGVFRLAGNRFQWDIDEARYYGISFSAVEAL